MITPEQMAKSGLESGEQKAVFVWAAMNMLEYPCLRWLHAIPNANSHKQVAEGVKGGISDIFLPFPKLGSSNFTNIQWYHGLYMEMKIESRRNEKNGGLSDDQISFQEYANSVGYKAVTCYGWKEAVKAIKEYLNG